MISKEELMRRLPTDFGGLPAGRIERVEHELEPWEKRCHALADVLDFHKIINTEEKRRGVEALGSELIGRLSYYERWIVALPIFCSKNRSSPRTSLPARWTRSPHAIRKIRRPRNSAVWIERRGTAMRRHDESVQPSFCRRRAG
jgi:hypothetical protein